MSLVEKIVKKVMDETCNRHSFYNSYFSCDLCGDTFDTLEEAYQHMIIKHDKKEGIDL
jgi:hypothetical protein